MSIVSEFRRELYQHATPSAAWRKVDLHNHSPASHDFTGNRATAVDDYAARIREQKLSVVGFTDHGRLPDPLFIKELGEKTGALYFGYMARLSRSSLVRTWVALKLE